MICAVIPAAGRSRRMGAAKLLLPLGGKPVIARVVDELAAAPVDRVYVVVAEGDENIPRALEGRPVHFVTNPDTAGEMLGSVRCALASMPAECTAVVMAPGDQPGVSRRVVARLVDAFCAGGSGIIVPVYGGRRGHPLVFAFHYRHEIFREYDAVGLRGLLQAYGDDVCEVAVDAPEVLEDMDLPEDYRRLVERYNEK